MPEVDHNRLLKAATDLLSALDEIGITATIIGGVAVSLVAESRHTGDLNALVVFDTSNIDTLLSELASRGFRPRFSNMADLALQARMITLIHEDSGSTVDLALGCLPFEQELIDRSETRLINNAEIRLPTPEDLVIMKAVAGRPKDLEDIRAIARAYPNVDRERIQFWVEQYGEVVGDPDLWLTIKALLDSFRG